MSLAGDENQPKIEIREHEGQWAIRFRDVAEFVIRTGEILGYVTEGAGLREAEDEFLDAVLPFYLELQGIPILHASAVEIDGRVVVFAGPSGSGKSSLATAMTKRGASFLADDVLALKKDSQGYQAFAGSRQVRLWPEAAEELLAPEQHRAIHPDWAKRQTSVDHWGRLCAEPARLGAVYLIDPDAGVCQTEEVRILPLRGHAGLLAVMQNLPVLAALAPHVQAERTRFLAELMQAVPVRRLRYPRSYDRLDRVLDAVWDDVRLIACGGR